MTGWFRDEERVGDNVDECIPNTPGAEITSGYSCFLQVSMPSLVSSTLLSSTGEVEEHL